MPSVRIRQATAVLQTEAATWHGMWTASGSYKHPLPPGTGSQQGNRDLSPTLTRNWMWENGSELERRHQAAAETSVSQLWLQPVTLQAENPISSPWLVTTELGDNRWARFDGRAQHSKQKLMEKNSFFTSHQDSLGGETSWARGFRFDDKMKGKTHSRGGQQLGNYGLWKASQSVVQVCGSSEKKQHGPALKNALAFWGRWCPHVPKGDRLVAFDVSYRYLFSRILIRLRIQQTSIYFNAYLLLLIKSQQNKWTSIYKIFINSHTSPKVYKQSQFIGTKMIIFVLCRSWSGIVQFREAAPETETELSWKTVLCHVKRVIPGRI